MRARARARECVYKIWTYVWVCTCLNIVWLLRKSNTKLMAIVSMRIQSKLPTPLLLITQLASLFKFWALSDHHQMQMSSCCLICFASLSWSIFPCTLCTWIYLRRLSVNDFERFCMLKYGESSRKNNNNENRFNISMEMRNRKGRNRI